MKRLMILAVMTALACGDDSSDGSSNSDETSTGNRRDAGRDSGRDAGRDARSDDDDNQDDDNPDDDIQDDEPNTDDDVRDAGRVDASRADAGRSDAGSTGDDCAARTYDNYGKAFMTKYCAECHAASVKGVAARKGAPDDAVFDTLAQIKTHLADIRETVIDLESMPFPTAKNELNDSERAEFGAWLDCGPN